MPALVWKRTDFSESSRLVTLLTRDEGKIKALAKGAHRPKSGFLGRLDHLNLVEPKFVRRRDDNSLRILRGVELLHEPRALREPRRYLAASHLVEVFDAALPEGRADRELFDLLAGAVVVLERCPQIALTTALAGIELRCLHALGELPDLTSCAACGQTLPQRPARRAAFLAANGRALTCAGHREPNAQPVAAATLDALAQLQMTPARGWAGLDRPEAATLRLLGHWLEAALEFRPKLRKVALEF